MENIINILNENDWDRLAIQLIDNEIIIKDTFRSQQDFLGYIEQNLTKYEIELDGHEISSDEKNNVTITFIFKFDSQKKHLTSKYIRSLADDIMLELNDEEVEEIKETEGSIRDKFMKVLTIDTHNVEPKYYPFDDSHTYLREDDDFYTNDQEEVLNNAPTTEGDFVTIVKVVK